MTFVSITFSCWLWWFPKIDETHLVTAFSAFNLTNWVTSLFYTDQGIDITIDNHFDNPFATAYQKNYLGSITCRYSRNERKLWERPISSLKIRQMTKYVKT